MENGQKRSLSSMEPAFDGKMESQRTLEGVWGPVWEAERRVVFGVNKA